MNIHKPSVSFYAEFGLIKTSWTETIFVSVFMSHQNIKQNNNNKNPTLSSIATHSERRLRYCTGLGLYPFFSRSMEFPSKNTPLILKSMDHGGDLKTPPFSMDLPSIMYTYFGTEWTARGHSVSCLFRWGLWTCQSYPQFIDFCLFKVSRVEVLFKEGRIFLFPMARA